MSDVTTTIRDDILRSLEETRPSSGDPKPPASYFMASIEMMAMSVFENNRALSAWMRGRGLDPHQGPDAVLALGLLLVLDAKHNPRPEPSDDDDFPDDHHH